MRDYRSLHTAWIFWGGYDDTLLWKIIYTWHMPIFFLIAGYLFSIGKSKKNIEWIINRSLKLLIPWFVWRWIIFLCHNIQFTGLSPFYDYLTPSALEYLKMFVTSPSYPIWFLFTMFLYSLIFAVFWELAQNKRVKIILVIAILMLSIILVKGTKISNLNYYGQYIVYYAGGIILGQFKDYFNSIKYKAVALPVLIILYVFNKFFLNMGTVDSWLKAYICIDIIFIVVQLIYKCDRFAKTKNILEWYGKNSLEIYLTQLLCLNIGVSIGWVRVFSIFITCTCMVTISVYLIKKTKYLDGILYGGILTYENKSIRLCR